MSGHVIWKKATACKVIQDGLCWPMVLKDYSKAHAKSYDVCHCIGKPSRRDEFPLHMVRVPQPFEKWVVSFVGLISPTARHSKAR